MLAALLRPKTPEDRKPRPKFPWRLFLATAATLCGVALLVLGVTLLSVPAALILAGVLLAALGLIALDVGEPSE